MPSYKERTPLKSPLLSENDSQGDHPPLTEPLLDAQRPSLDGASEAMGFDSDATILSASPSTPTAGFRDTRSRISAADFRVSISPLRPPSDTVTLLAFWAMLFLLLHASLMTCALIMNWSVTKVDTENNSITLYPSNFWTNVNNFMDSGAQPLAYLLVLTGVGQPSVKALLLPVLLALPLVPFYSLLNRRKCSSTLLSKFSPSTARRMLLVQEATSKLTATTSNVGVVLLNVITLSFHLKNDPRVTAEAITDTLWGTVLYYYAGVACCMAVCVIREIYQHSTTSHRIVKARRSSAPSPPPTFASKLASSLALISAILTFLCLIPTLSLPLVRFTYSGVAAALIDDADATADGLIRELKLTDIGDGLYNNTPEHFIALNNAFFFYFNTFACPIFAMLSCMWYRYASPNPGVLRIVRWTFTLSMLDTVVIAFFFAAPEIDLISTWVFDGTALCEALVVKADDQCLDIVGEILPGGYWCAGLALCFDIFVFITLWQAGSDENEVEKRWVTLQENETRASLVKDAEAREKRESSLRENTF